MATIITFPSALEYWLSEKGIPYHFHFDRYSSRVKNKIVLLSNTSGKDLLNSVKTLNFTLPVHLSVTEHVKRFSNSSVVFHKLPTHLPEYSFYQIAESTYIASPELCFIQAAAVLSVPELVLLANELCGIYVKDCTEEYGQRRREPVTTTASIRSYINKAEKIHGLQKARTAIRYALDNSNSPIESRLAALAALPLSWGGYGLILPQLNLEVKFPNAAAEYMERTSILCDMVWAKQKVVLEYDSNLTHLGIRQHFTDKKRATALTLAGYKVISITAEQIRNFNTVETMFLQVRSALNMRTHKDRMERYLDLRWNVVHKLLLYSPDNRNMI